MSRKPLIHQIFEDCVDRVPDAVALISGSEKVTFAELDALAENIADAILASHGLAAASVLPPDTMIGLAIGRSIEATAGALGILKAGGAWVPLDPSYPPSRLAYMLEDSAAALVLSTRPLLDRLAFLSDSGTKVLCVDELSTQSSGRTTRAEIGGPDPLAYVIYTSGSTGKPNGVLGPHSAILSRFEWMWETFPFAADELTCAKTALNFVDSIWEMFGGLLQGIPCVIADDSMARDPLALLDMLSTTGVTRLVVVPSLLAALIGAASHTGVQLDRLRFVTASGERLPSELARRIGELAPDAVLLNLYGSTEMAADATCCVIDADAVRGEIVSIGKPLGRMRIHIVDEDLNQVDVGVEGELCVSGPGLARGYHNKPDLTAKKWIPNPFAAEGDTEHARLFRSGDIAVLREGGDIDYVGRRDFQIKLRGFKIEPSEIEATLATHPAIRECAVAAIDSERGRRLVAFYVGEHGVEYPDAHALREFSAERLADWMVPSYFLPLDDMPRLPNGKLDRRGLRLPEDFDARGDIVEARDEVEEVFVAIWRETLGVEAISVTDDFFEVGGDSLLAARVSIVAREAGYSLTPADVYEHTTLEALARYARTAQPAEAHAPVPEGPTRLSPMQRYYFSWAGANPNKFNVPFIARLAEPLDAVLLDKAFRAVIDHHPALRLRFAPGDDARYADDDNAFAVPIHEFALPAGSEDDHFAYIEREVTRLHDTLDVTAGPVMTAAVFTDPHGDNHHFFLAMHHLISDAISLQITVEDLRLAYVALAQGGEATLPAPTTPFHQWVDSVVDYAGGPGATAQWEYWLSQAQDAHPMPEDDADAPARQRDVTGQPFEVLSAAEVDAAWERLGGAFQTTLIHAVVAALALVANERSGQRNLVFHKAAHGRERCIRGADVSRTVGWFTTHTPITIALPDGPVGASAKVLEHVGEQYQAIPDNGLAHSALRYFSDDPRAVELARFDTVRTLLNYVGDAWDNYDGELFHAAAPALLDLPNAVGADNLADYHLHVYASLLQGVFRVTLYYTLPNYRPETIAEMGTAITEHIRKMVLG
ncbi:amino acid adenylation domain-containing protein [Mycobacterium sp. BK086]|uniref:non-ribosomal peptide synthetase n=1 Tax=Mycobacterium sp. BK086 TaxID=2512165 RepID=UPI0010E59F8B|nr:non-ribosomal peptide synthetase [Mycobacterium sp. BK086]TDO09988.1 amino acid adenylation domain-containing protein [Mycobacterium sp. BK086]